MDRRILVGMALLLGPLVARADPPAAGPAAISRISPPAAPESGPQPGPPHAGGPGATAPLAIGRPLPARPSRPLDLRLGDLRHYFTPAEMQSPLPDVIGDEVVVEGGRDSSESIETPIPVGLVAPFWAVSHPLSAWRVFVPDPNAQPLPRPDPETGFLK